MATPVPPLPDHPRIRSERWRLSGAPELHRLWVTPEDNPRGWAIFLPGLGDFVERYADWFLWLADHGWGVLAPDWPGHGRSAGPRGDIENLAQADAVVEACLDTLESRHGGGRRALWAHSMGSLVALRQLARSPLEWRWTWLASPLLAPSHNTASWKRSLAPTLARLSPRLSMDTGVRPAQCQVHQAGQSLLAPDSLWHHSVSARFGQSLLENEKLLTLQSRRIRRDMPFLITQGSADPVCPAAITRPWVESLIERGLSPRYHEIPDALHEPLLDPQFAPALRPLATDWLTQALAPAPTQSNDEILVNTNGNQPTASAD